MNTPRTLRAACLAGCLALALPSLAAADAAAGELLVLPVEGAPPPGLEGLDAELTEALARGAALTSVKVDRATSSLSDAAMLVGCDPAEAACLDAVAETLDVEFLLSSTVAPADGGGARVTVTAVRRGQPPQRRSFDILADQRDLGVAALETAVPELLGVPVGGPTTTDAPVDAPALAPADGGELAAAAPRPRPRMPRGPMLVAASGVVLVASGLAMWAVASGTQADVDDAPTATVDDLERLAGLESDGRAQATAGNVLVVVGAAALAGGAAWLYWDLRTRGDERPLAVAPLWTGSATGLALGGTW